VVEKEKGTDDLDSARGESKGSSKGKSDLGGKTEGIRAECLYGEKTKEGVRAL